MITCSDIQSGLTMVGYFTCAHVMDGAPIVHIIEPKGPGPKNAGELLCGQCAAVIGPLDPEIIRIVCAACARRTLLPMVVH